MLWRPEVLALGTIKSKLSAQHKADHPGIERVMHKMVDVERDWHFRVLVSIKDLRRDPAGDW